jgi:hypothetical protein
VKSAGFFSVDFEIHRGAWNGIQIKHYVFELAKDTGCDSLQNMNWNEIEAVIVPTNSSFETSLIFKRGERDKGGIGPALVAGTAYFYRVAAVNARGQQSAWSDYKTNPTPAVTGRILFPVLVVPNNTLVNETTCLDIKSGKPLCSTIYSAQSSFYEAIDMRYGLTGSHTYRWPEPISFGREGAELFAFANLTDVREGRVVVDCLGHRCFEYCPEPLYTNDMTMRCFPPARLTGITFRNARTDGTEDHGAVLRVVAAVDPLQRRMMVITDCIFTGNYVNSGNGGALWMEAKRGTAAVWIINTKFHDNGVFAGDGGAVAVDGTDLNIESCTFLNNFAKKSGGISFNNSVNNSTNAPDNTEEYTNSSTTSPTIVIDVNGNGGALAIIASSIGSVANMWTCDISANTAQGLGGGVYVKESKYVVNLVERVAFTMDGNKAQMGGNLYVESSEIEFLVDSSDPPTGIAANLKNGYAADSGGGIACIGSVMQLRHAALNTNVAGLDGGAVYGILCIASIHISDVKQNEATRMGAGLFFSSLSTLLLAESVLEKNVAGENGGAAGLDRCRKVHVFQSRFSHNEAAEGAGLHFDRVLRSPVIEASEVYENKALQGGGGGIFWRKMMPTNAGHVVLDRNEALYGSNIASTAVALISSASMNDVVDCTNVEPFRPEISLTIIDYYNNIVRRKNKATTVVATATSGTCLHLPADLTTGRTCKKTSQNLFGKTVQEISGLLGTVNFTALGIRGWPGTHLINFDAVGIPTLSRRVKVADCERGHFLDHNEEEAGGKCSHCPAGWYKNDTGIHSCRLCEAGTSCLVGSTTPKHCDPGTFGPRNGLRLCQDCEGGQYQMAKQQLACIVCPKGWLQNLTQSVRCDECKEGHHGPTTAAIVCQSCAEGQYQNLIAQEGCLYCPAGFAQSNETSSSCRPCLPGTYSKNDGSSVCEPCESGTVAVLEQSVRCLICKKGTYANITKGCLDCPRGYVSITDKQKVCAACGKGSISKVDGSQLCTECPSGYIASDIAQYKCEECRGGQYSPVPGSQLCTACNPGKRTSTKAPIECGDCPAGQSASAALATSCYECPGGWHAPKKSMPECLACPGGWASPNAKSLQCDSCLAGSSCSAASRFPFDCPAGWISAEARSTSCIACPAGKAADGDNNVVCTTCKPGFYSAMENSSVCESCMRGQYASNELSLRCEKCPQGELKYFFVLNDFFLYSTLPRRYYLDATFS